MRKKSGKRSGFIRMFPPLVMLSKCMDVGRAQRAHPKHPTGGYSALYKAAHRLFVHSLFHFTSLRGSKLEFCLWSTLTHGAVQRYPDERATIVGESRGSRTPNKNCRSHCSCSVV